MAEPLTDEELEERRQNLAFIRRQAPFPEDLEFTTTLIMQEEWLATTDA